MKTSAQANRIAAPIFLLAFVLVLIGCLPTPAAAADSCLAKAVFPGVVCNVDPGMRVFVAIPEINFKQDSINKVGNCLQKMGWKEPGWNISYYSSAEYCLYKTDPKSEKLDTGKWAEAYLGEYDNATGEFTTRPNYPKQEKIYRFKKYKFRNR